jgi:hypothetical protein
VCQLWLDIYRHVHQSKVYSIFKLLLNLSAFLFIIQVSLSLINYSDTLPMKSCFLLLTVFVLSFQCDLLIGQNNYRDYDSMTQVLEQLQNNHPDRVQLERIATSPGGHNIWKLTIGSGDIENKPALAIVGGVDGAHILGIELALKAAESILEQEDTDNRVFHIFPNLNPDASEQYFSSLQYERSENGKETDLDRDGAISEDGFDDLNGDGMITMMRVADVTGGWMPHPDDERVMVKADPMKGEKGRYRLLPEGRDRDQDGEFNEDPPGGVNLNKNFTFRHPSFEFGAGEFPVSENENRALLDLLFESFNIYAVLTFSPNNNLSNPWTYNRSGASKRVITSILEEDAPVFQSVSELYKETVPQENASGYQLQPGGFAEWAYFHYARYSFTTDGWWVPDAPAGENETTTAAGDNSDLKFLRWAESEGLNKFTEWQRVDHPDFPGQSVEVGGIHPFAATTPPYSMVDSLSRQTMEFITGLVDMQPDLSFENISTEDAGSGLTRITLDLHNHGQMPTSTELGTRTQWVRPINITLEMDDGVDVASGRPRFQIERLEGRASKQVSWLLRGRGDISITAGTPSAGFTTHQQAIR